MKFVFPAAALLLVSGMAVATEKSTDAPGNMAQICKTMKETGTRLSTKRVCKTRDQWLQDKAQTRSVIERSQIFQSKEN